MVQCGAVMTSLLDESFTSRSTNTPTDRFSETQLVVRFELLHFHPALIGPTSTAFLCV